MAFTLAGLSAILSAIPAVITTGESVVANTEQLYKFVGTAVVEVEQAYKDVANSGGTKFAAVVASAKEFAAEIGVEWSTVEGEITAWINAVVALYSAGNNLLNNVKTST